MQMEKYFLDHLFSWAVFGFALFSIIPIGKKYVCVCLHECVWLGVGEMEREQLGGEVRNMYFK